MLESCERINSDALRHIRYWKQSTRDFYNTSVLISELDYCIERARTKKEITERIIKEEMEKKDSLFLASFSLALDKVYNRLSGIFIKNAEQALDSSKEYNYPPFREGLQKGYYNSELISVAPLSKSAGSGFKCKVKINMDSVYGRLESWGAAITAARNLQEIGTTNVKQASLTWYLKIYSVDRLGKQVHRKLKGGKSTDITHLYIGKYTNTLGIRLASAIGFAPWWKLLDKGNVSVKIPGNERQGGGANSGIQFPETTTIPTNFVSKTRIEIKDEIETAWAYEYRSSMKNIIETIKEVRDDVALVPKLISHLERVKEIVKKKIVETDPTSVLIRLIERRVRKYQAWQVLERGDIFTIAERINQLISLGSDQPIRIGGRRMRTKSIINQFYREMEKFK